MVGGGSELSSKRSAIFLKSKYDFTWEVLDVIISGRSSIDSPNGFQTSGRDEATRFIESYGYNPQDPIEAAEILGNFQEALNFIRGKQFSAA